VEIARLRGESDCVIKRPIFPNEIAQMVDYQSEYDCDDYFGSELATQRLWSEPDQLWLIEPSSKIEEVVDSHGEPIGFLQVGRPGVDGIAFGYRLSHPGFWAYYPIEGECQYLAETVQDFLKRWYAGDGTV
jgi:hypothetical protein